MAAMCCAVAPQGSAQTLLPPQPPTGPAACIHILEKHTFTEAQAQGMKVMSQQQVLSLTHSADTGFVCGCLCSCRSSSLEFGLGQKVGFPVDYKECCLQALQAMVLLPPSPPGVLQDFGVWSQVSLDELGEMVKVSEAGMGSRAILSSPDSGGNTPQPWCPYRL